MKTLFDVTYEIVTPESSKQGDTAENGFLAQGVTLREALELLNETPGERNGPPEADEYPVSYPSWISVYGGIQDDGNNETRAIHFPESLGQGSRMRIARLLGTYGIPKRHDCPMCGAKNVLVSYDCCTAGGSAQY